MNKPSIKVKNWQRFQSFNKTPLTASVYLLKQKNNL